jgi:hypothetical protein
MPTITLKHRKTLTRLPGSCSYHGCRSPATSIVAVPLETGVLDQPKVFCPEHAGLVWTEAGACEGHFCRHCACCFPAVTTDPGEKLYACCPNCGRPV